MDEKQKKFDSNAYLSALSEDGKIQITKDVKAKIKRLEFPVGTKDILAKRVGYKCSCPGCRLTTIGPGDDIDKVTMFGEAAHIIGAIKDDGTISPRADETKTDAEIRSIENGIWLCRNHHKVVDSKTSTYTVEVLRKWKKDAEDEQAKYLEETKSFVIEKYFYKTLKTDKGLELEKWNNEQWCLFAYIWDNIRDIDALSLEPNERGFTENYQEWLGKNSIKTNVSGIEFDKASDRYIYGSAYLDSIKSVLEPMRGVLYLDESGIQKVGKFDEVSNDLFEDIGDNLIEIIKRELSID